MSATRTMERSGATAAAGGRRPLAGRLRRRVPAPLAWLLGIVAMLGVVWAFASPPFLAPDEDVHFAYLQSITERGRLPGDPGRPALSEEEYDAVAQTNINPAIVNPYAQPDWSRSSREVLARLLRHADRTNGGGPSLATTYPPLSYLYDTVPYALASHGDVLDRFFAVRLGSVVWLLMTTLGAWLLAGEVFGRDRLTQLVAAGTVGLWPMIDFMSTAVSPDPMSYGLSTLALWLSVAVVRSGAPLRRTIALGAVVGAALVTKTPNLALVPAALLALAVVALRDRRWVAAAGGVAALLVPVVIWTVYARSGDRAGFAQASGAAAGATGLDVGNFLSYLWQFYFPKLWFMDAINSGVPVISYLPAYNTWIGMGSAAFGWASIWFPHRIYLLIAAGVALVVAGAAVSGWRWWRSGRPNTLTVVLLVISVAVLLAGLHWSDYHQYLIGLPFMQGRYLFPVAAVGGLLVGLALRAVPARRRALVAGGWLAALVVFQIASLGLIMSHFHA